MQSCMLSGQFANRMTDLTKARHGQGACHLPPSETRSDNDVRFQSNLDRQHVLGTAETVWDAVRHPSLAGYRIYYGTGTRAYFQPSGHDINTCNTMRYSVKELGGAKTYYFAVTAFGTCGNQSTFSNEAVKPSY